MLSQLLITVNVNPVEETLADGKVKVASITYVPRIAAVGVGSSIPIVGISGLALLKEVERKSIFTPAFVYVQTGVPHVATEGPLYTTDNSRAEAGGFLIS